MILTEAKKRAQREFDDVLDAHRAPPRQTCAPTSTPPRDDARRPTASRAGARRHRRQPRPARGRGWADRAAAVKLVGVDVGSTTVKAVVVRTARSAGRTTSATTPPGGEGARVPRPDGGRVRPRRRARPRLLHRLGRRLDRAAGRRQDASRRSSRSPPASRRCIPEVRFVSEIGGEDMKTIFFTADRRPARPSRSTCSRRAAAAPAPSSRRPRASCRSPRERLAAMPLRGHEPAQGQLASAASSPRPTPTRW